MTTAEFYTTCYADPAYRTKRNRLDAVSQWLSQREPRSLLDFGCGRGEVLGLARERGIEALGCEIVPSLCTADRAKPGSWTRDLTPVDLIAPDAHPLPYDDDVVEAVVCIDVLEHIELERLGPILAELDRIREKHLLLGICTREGRGHVTIRDSGWWAGLVLAVLGVCPMVAPIAHPANFIFLQLGD